MLNALGHFQQVLRTGIASLESYLNGIPRGELPGSRVSAAPRPMNEARGKQVSLAQLHIKPVERRQAFTKTMLIDWMEGDEGIKSGEYLERCDFAEKLFGKKYFNKEIFDPETEELIDEFRNDLKSMAAVFNHPTLVKLLSPTQDCNTSNNIVPKVLEAIQTDNPLVLKALLDAGADKDQTLSVNNTCLTLAFYATTIGSSQCLKVLLEAGVDKDQTTSDGFTLACFAVAENHIKCLEVLIDLNADLNTAGNKAYSPLIAAIYTSRIDLLSALINSKKVNLKESFFEGEHITPLEIAEIILNSPNPGALDCYNLLARAIAQLDSSEAQQESSALMR